MEAMREAWTDERLDDLADRMDQGFARVDARIDRFEDRVDKRFEQIDRRFEKFEGEVGARFEKFEMQMTSRFDWLMRLMLAGYVAAVIGFFAAGS
jgi:tetrahydromethanopterin S-methyltransferase subunit G